MGFANMDNLRTKSSSIVPERLAFYYSLYLALIISPWVGEILRPYGGIIVLLASALGAILLGLDLRVAFMKIGKEEIMDVYWKSFILIYLGIIIGSAGVYVSILKNNFILALSSVVIPYLMEILGAFLFRTFCYEVFHYIGTFTSKDLGNYAIVVALIYPITFLLGVEHSMAFLAVIYAMGVIISYRFFKSLPKFLELTPSSH